VTIDIIAVERRLLDRLALALSRGCGIEEARWALEQFYRQIGMWGG
jgi:hypothetical protein